MDGVSTIVFLRGPCGTCVTYKKTREYDYYNFNKMSFVLSVVNIVRKVPNGICVVLYLSHLNQS